MKNLIVLFFLLSLSVVVSSQDDDMPEMHSYYLQYYYWQDTITAGQKQFWPNGNKKIDYCAISDNKKLRREYFEDGNLKLTVVVEQVYGRDTITTTDPNTGELWREVDSGYSDIPDGDYFEYNAGWPAPVTRGQYLNGERYGLWQTETGVLGQIMTATYDKEGNLNGPYKKYYYDSRNPTGKIEWKGQYGMVTQSLTKIDPDTGENVVSVLTRSERTGTWTKYDQAGKVLLTVTYDWKSNANDK